MDWVDQDYHEAYIWFEKELNMKKLDIYLSFRQGLNLYDKVSLPVRDKFVLTFMEFIVIMFLANNREYKKASDIVEVLGIAKSHVSMTILSLEERGLLDRTVDPCDKRSSILELKNTEAIVEEGRKAQNRFMEILLDGLDEKELMDTKKSFEKIEENIMRNV